jgi:hypothetical protein
VLVLDQNDKSCALGVEAAGDFPDGVVHDLLDTGVGDGRGLLELVDGAALVGGLGKGELAGHGRYAGGECALAGER